MKKIHVAAVGLMMLGGIVADANARLTWDIGLKGGVNVAGLYGNDADSIGTDNRTGFVGGGFVAMNLDKNRAIRFELLYAMKGAKTSTDDLDITAKLDYVELPVLVVFTRELVEDESSVSMFVGPVFGFEINAEAEGRQGNSFLGMKLDDLTSNFDFGGTLGLNGALGIGRASLILDVRYTVSFVSVNKDQDLDIKNNAFSAMAGVSIPVGYR